ncbi:hypothetical protein J7L67_01455 [bacterium]|nr:hypothetical protein [bacterium]
MVFQNDIKKFDRLIELGFLYEAKKFFSNLLMDTTDPIIERICENRLNSIRKKMNSVKNCCLLNIDSINEDSGFIVCSMKISYNLPYIKDIIHDIFSNSHKKNYPDTSKISIFQPATQTTYIELSGCAVDNRCDWCFLFRKNLLYYIGKKKILRIGHCPIGKEIS